MIADRANFVLTSNPTETRVDRVTVLNIEADWLLIRSNPNLRAATIKLFDDHMVTFGRRRAMNVHQLCLDTKVPPTTIRSPYNILGLIVHGYQKLGLSDEDISNKLKTKEHLSCPYLQARNRWIATLINPT